MLVMLARYGAAGAGRPAKKLSAGLPAFAARTWLADMLKNMQQSTAFSRKERRAAPGSMPFEGFATEDIVPEGFVPEGFEPEGFVFGRLEKMLLLAIRKAPNEGS